MLKLSCGSFGFWRPKANKSWSAKAELLLRVSTKVLLDQMKEQNDQNRRPLQCEW